MAENETQGITRRDLLKRGAALGGAVVWATPVVQTLGMGRAFAQVPSPAPSDISYIAITWTCDGGATWFFTKNEEDGTSDGSWEPDPGSIPGCEGMLPGWDGATKTSGAGFFSITYNGDCATITVSSSLADCEIHYVLKGGQDPCASGTLSVGSNPPVCL